MQIQISLGSGSLGTVWRDVEAAELDGFIANSAAEMHTTTDSVEASLAQGGTLWLCRADGTKIRGYDAAAAALRAQQQELARRERTRTDGYSDHY